MPQKFSFDADVVRQLAELLDATDLNEIEYAEGERRIRVVRHPRETVSTFPVSPAMQAFAATQHSLHQGGALGSAPAPVQNLADHPGAVKSPMVGTVFLASEPGAPPFIKVGDDVAQGQTLLIVEAMKVMNPIRATQAGKVTQILVKDTEPVEFGEVLLVLE
jgi:acetyl-CoA carboxylase biotin carboxyl carrier protein